VNWFRTLTLRTFQIIVVVLPLTGYLPLYTNIHPPPLLWPPIGSVAVYASGIATMFVGLIGSLIKFSRRSPSSILKFSLSAAFIALCGYVILLSTYVKGVETPNNGTQYRAVGNKRTDLAKVCYPNEVSPSDEELLKCGGLNEGDIERMWTASSVRLIRLSLFLSYVVVLGSLNLAAAAASHKDNGN